MWGNNNSLQVPGTLLSFSPINQGNQAHENKQCNIIMTICDYILIIFEVCILIMILTSHKYAGDTVVTEE